MTKKAKASPLQETDYCDKLQSKPYHHCSKRIFRVFIWIRPFVVEKVLPHKNYVVPIFNSNKTQVFHCIRFRKLTTDTPSEDSYTKESFRAVKTFVIPQNDFHSITWEAESIPSFSEHPELKRDPVTIEQANNSDAVNQQNVDKSFPRRHKNGSDSFMKLYALIHTRVKNTSIPEN